jgi:hypothetical protein
MVPSHCALVAEKVCAVPWQRLRTIVEMPSATSSIDEFTDRIPRFGEAMQALTWLLARNPQPDGSIRREVGDMWWTAYVQAGDALAQTPDIWVTYTFDANEVVLYGVNALPLSRGRDE